MRPELDPRLLHNAQNQPDTTQKSRCMCDCRDVPCEPPHLHLLRIAPVATQAPEINEGMRNLGGGVSLGVDCVKHAPEVAPALRYAMGNALVADDPARAAQLNRQQHYKVADLDGTLYAVNGSMSGGTTRCGLIVILPVEPSQFVLLVHRFNTCTMPAKQQVLMRSCAP